ncbi:MAG: phenylalanine--tRNA ligase beta subunit-related protein [Planctomycetota bacterium]|jgi:DNA/RNA-binding domain of Phe-tRNA-synthetase-like protein
MLSVDPHPLLRWSAFTTQFPQPLDALPSPDWLVALLAPEAAAPLQRDEEVRQAIRNLLRHGGYKPTGRGKPASEYLVRAAGEGALLPINLAVDACNAVSLHSGLPISLVDLDLAAPPFRIALAPPGARYVFNPAGQEIDLKGLLCLWDAEGPCANAVKDAQRTKTHAATRRTLAVVWGCTGHEDRLHRAVAWYRALLERAGAASAPVEAA